MAVREYTFVNGPETSTIPGAGVVYAQKVVSKSASYIILDDDEVSTILVTDTSANPTITLPTASANSNRLIKVIKTASDSGYFTLAAEGTEKINTNLASINCYFQNQSITVECDGSGWYTQGKLPDQLIQTFTTISDIGSVSQQLAGHIYASDILGAGTDIAYFKFANGAMTTDEEGTYTLVASGSPANANGITGSDYAVTLGGSDYYYNGTLLDSTSTLSNGLGLNFWFKADDGQPAAQQFLFRKDNDLSGGSEDWIYALIETNGQISVYTYYNGSQKYVKSSTTLNNGATGWFNVCIGWSANGLELYVNGILEDVDRTATTIMPDGTADDFYIGSNNGSNNFTGDIALFRVMDHIFTPDDVALMGSVRYTMPSIYQSQNLKLDATIQSSGSSFYDRNIDNFQVVKKDTSYFYVKGWQFDKTDKLKIVARG